MPDGGKLRDYLRADREQSHDVNNKKRKQGRAKDDLWQQLQRNKVLAGNELDLQEIRAIERAGHRRRQRWLNDKILRDMAGPLTARTMEAQFNPVPFGSYPPPSAFELAMQEPLWEHFRNIDLDKEAKVLQRWEQHNLEEQQQQQQQHCYVNSGPLTQHQQQAAAAADALGKWRSVSRSARAALKKANVHSVLELEMQLINFLTQEPPDDELSLDLPDGFARLIVHGLAQFHGLVSTTQLVRGIRCISISRKQPPQQQQEHAAHCPAVSAEIVTLQQAVVNSTEATSDSSPSPHRRVHSGTTDTAGDWLMRHSGITCTDVVMAIKELGANFDQPNLMKFMKTHVHGSSSSDDFHML